MLSPSSLLFVLLKVFIKEIIICHFATFHDVGFVLPSLLVWM